ncbi:MAG: TIGR03084 family protein [Gammaproteobacteria bacterium]|nr:TIGR03084 family protein [Gammaproteobacteria bacterium]
MLQQAIDLQAEGDELYALLDSLSDSDWSRPTPFKSWSVNEVVSHLHSGDWMAVLSLTDSTEFLHVVALRNEARARGESTFPSGPELTQGRELLAQWREYFDRMCQLLGNAEPTARLKWVGPDMGVRMFTTARQMETWAHGQDVYDLLRRPRTYDDRLKNIAVIGVHTFGWTFANRGEKPPGPAPHVVLTAPSGAIWEWNEPDNDSLVQGNAVDFCHVVTQGRNIADTNLNVVGDVAARWMSVAQCFAGDPKDPPAPGQRSW